MVYLHSLPHGLHLPDLCRCCCKLVVLLSNENTSQWALQSTNDQTACGQTRKRDNQRVAHQFLLQQHILADCPLIPATDNFPHDDSEWSFPPWSLISSFLLPAVEALQSRKGEHFETGINGAEEAQVEGRVGKMDEKGIEEEGSKHACHCCAFFLDAIASPSSYPCGWVGQSVSDS